MRKMNLIASALAVIYLLAAALALGQNTNNQSSIVGTWIFTTSVTTPPGTPLFVFTELAAINPGGTYVDAHGIGFNSNNPFAPPPLAVDSSDAYGSWQRVGDSNQFATTHKRLLFAGVNTPPAVYGSFFLGQNIGFLTVETVLTLQTGNNGETLTGPFTAQLTNLGGQVVFVASGTVSATRLKIQPVGNP